MERASCWVLTLFVVAWSNNVLPPLEPEARHPERTWSGAIFAMTVPYVMIHYGKEFPETLGAIFAGIFLGTLAMRTRSIWGGFLVHSFVAVSMDIASMLQTTGLPEAFAP